MSAFAHYGDPYIKGPKRELFLYFFTLFSAAEEAALAADLITVWKPFRGGCASSRLDHGFPGPDDGGEGRGCASSRLDRDVGISRNPGRLRQQLFY